MFKIVHFAMFKALSIAMFSSVNPREAAPAKLAYVLNQVLRCIPADATHIAKLAAQNWTFWRNPSIIGTPVDILAGHGDMTHVQTTLDAHGIPFKVLIGNLQHVLDVEAKVSADENLSFHEKYHEWTQVYQHFEDLASSFPQLASWRSIGNTYRDKHIMIMVLSTDPHRRRSALFLDAGIHAREWITVASLSFIAEDILRTYGTNSNITHLLDHFDIIICPIVNVDGYEYTWTTDRLWRKTRSPNANSSCIGTDANRNWDFQWGGDGESTDACSEAYRGDTAASEVEVLALQRFLCAHNDTIKGYVNLHSYSQLWMSSWGYKAELPRNFDAQEDVSKAVVEAIEQVHGVKFVHGAVFSTVYPASGISADYAYGACGIKYSYSAELRDKGQYGFLLPADQIVPSGEEILAGIVAMATQIERNENPEASKTVLSSAAGLRGF